MIVFAVLLFLLGLLLEIFSLKDGLRHLHYDCSPSKERLEPGESFELVTRLGNRSRLPVSYLRTETYLPAAVELPQEANLREERFRKCMVEIFRLWGRQRVERRRPAYIEKRGVHSFEGAALYRGDFLGLHETGATVLQTKEVLVYPRRLSDSRLIQTLGNYCGDIVSQRWLIRDPILTMGVREYTGREAMNTISWSQSARRGEFMVREFDYTKELSCTILLALNGLEHMETELLDRCCSIVRTACELMTEQGIKVALHTNAALQGYTFRGVWSCEADRDSGEDVLDTLARALPLVRSSAEELVDSCSAQREQENAYIFVAPHATPAITKAVELLQQSSRMEVMLLVGEEWEDTE